MRKLEMPNVSVTTNAEDLKIINKNFLKIFISNGFFSKTFHKHADEKISTLYYTGCESVNISL